MRMQVAQCDTFSVLRVVWQAAWQPWCSEPATVAALSAAKWCQASGDLNKLSACVALLPDIFSSLCTSSPTSGLRISLKQMHCSVSLQALGGLEGIIISACLHMPTWQCTDQLRCQCYLAPETRTMLRSPSCMLIGRHVLPFPGRLLLLCRHHCQQQR